MPKRKDENASLAPLTESLYLEVRSILEAARGSVYRAVNAAMVQAYWQVGRLIVEHEQRGEARAGYGRAVIASLAAQLTRDFGRGLDERNLWYMRSFYLKFPILNAARSESSAASGLTAASLQPAEASPPVRHELSWTHYRMLLGVDDPGAAIPRCRGIGCWRTRCTALALSSGGAREHSGSCGNARRQGCPTPSSLSKWACSSCGSEVGLRVLWRTEFRPANGR